MRKRVRQSGITVNAIAGTHVVFLAFDVIASKKKGLRGFAIRREDHEEGEVAWIRGMKTFAATEPHPAPGETFSTRDHPIQGFQWGDYSAKPGRRYTYSIAALYGPPDDLKVRGEVDVTVTTETELGAKHSAFFNRGSVATQEYARRFQNRPPSEAGDGAYEWLSRGLLEALVAFLERADGPKWSIHAAVYEFQWDAALEAVRAARQRGARVRVLYDDIEKWQKDKKTGKPKPNGPWKKNRDAVKANQIASVCAGRTNGQLMHNKFFVLSERQGTKDVPVAVWTGSTNLTENGIFGHSNVGQICEDPKVAQSFLDYWHQLEGDPRVDNDYRKLNTALIACPPNPWTKGTVCVFSPRSTASTFDALEWYARIADAAKDGLFMTFAFGMHRLFKDVYGQKDSVLRMALLESAGNNYRTIEQDRKELSAIRARPNVVVAMGNRIPVNAFDRWLKELDAVNRTVHVHWIHTKYMIVDPLGPEPIVVSGSANFSEASTNANDENMLVIRGDKRIADIFFGEYMRLYSHYAFREAVARTLAPKKGKKPLNPERWTPQYLVPNDTWMSDYFRKSDKTGRRARREYFAGAMSV